MLTVQRRSLPALLLLSALALAAFSSLVGVGCTGCTSCDPDPEPEPDPTPEEPFDAAAAIAASQAEWDPEARQAAITAGQEAIERHQCNRCHTIDEIEPAGRSFHCTSCHIWMDGLTPDDRLYGLLSSRYGEATLQRYQRNIHHYKEVPDLTRVGLRLSPRWIARFVREPFDLRPMMEETMVRTQVSEEDARVLARYFAAVAEVEDPFPPGGTSAAEPSHGERPSAARIREGERLFQERGCALCHTFGNRETGRTVEQLRSVGVAAKLAPNLRFVRERVRPEVLTTWIRAPRSFNPDTLMPEVDLDADEAGAIADFLLWADPELRPIPEAPSLTPPPAVDRPVAWAEVKEEVLGRICVHCHMNDHERDNGPGNLGGFGWPGSRLRMRTYETLVSGAAQPGHLDDPERISVLQPAADGGVPPIIEAMMRRRVEELRDRVAPFADHERPAYPEAPPGMPMGLPSMSDEQIGLLRAWIEQGCPGPTEVSGMPGIDDGFLVPDGPIGVNHGCEVRAPAEERPSWSTQPPPEWARPHE